MAKNEYFGRYLKAGINSIALIESKTAVTVEQELAEQFELSSDSMQKYKAGNIPTNLNLIKAIAINCVNRGKLGEEWLKSFLDLADYPNTHSVIDELFPKKIEAKKKEKLNDNLPSPSYSKFIMRRTEFDKVIDGLLNRSAVVLLRSLGGMGKTSLAREIASQCISTEPEYASLPVKFDTAIWVSDANNPGTTNLTVVLDAIAQTLDYNEIVKLAIHDKTVAVNKLLSKHKILLIIDNFETITDHYLLDWVTSLPEPSKCIITTREYHRAFRQNTRDIELGGMTPDEARSLIQNKMSDLGISNKKNKIEDFDPLVRTCEGNPKAIEMALGIIKHRGKTQQEAIEELTSIKGDFFKDLFRRAWDLLDADGKNILMIMSMFPNGTKPKPIQEVLEIGEHNFETAISKLIDLSLINIKEEGINSIPFYYLHPLVYSFSSQKLKENSSLETTCRNRWLDYYLKLTNQIGFCWNDTDKLKMLDDEGLREGIEYVIDWANKNERYDYVIKISENVKYYFYIRGIWSSQLNLLRASVGRKTSNAQVEFDALVYHLNILCKQGNKEEAEVYASQVTELKNQNKFSEASLIDYNHAIALHHLRNGELETAVNLWEENLKNKKIDAHQVNANKRWLAVGLYTRGATGDLKEAKKILNELADDKDNENLVHSALSAAIYLTKIDFKEGNPDKALPRIKTSLELSENRQEVAFIPEFEMLYGEYLKIKGINNSEAIEYFEKAAEHFEKLGSTNKVYEVSIRINQLKNKD
ncbi:MAG: hypothetical protein JPMHGGIA_00454 [Saprospiraceae bacterium]|jgi:tetratricopeptide (TPR) repeat protein|nr:hypothetical protein [Saprospiraceae bacterium]